MSSQSSEAFVHILSDLHLLDPKDSFYQSVLRFIEEIPQRGDHLALAGDIFDVYVGNKAHFREKHRPFFKAIERACSRGISAHHVEGNHDFWLKDSYRSMGCSQVEVHGDFIEITLAGRTLRIEHGDLAYTDDQTYLLLRRFFRSSLGKFCIDLAPGRLLNRLGETWSHQSRTTKKPIQEWSDGDLSRLRALYFAYSRQVLQERRLDALVMGHCHDPHECEGYMNVGLPMRHRQWVRWTPSKNHLERVDYAF